MSISNVTHVHGCVRISVKKCKPSNINGATSYDIILEDEQGDIVSLYAFAPEEGSTKIFYEEE